MSHLDPIRGFLWKHFVPKILNLELKTLENLWTKLKKASTIYEYDTYQIKLTEILRYRLVLMRLSVGK